MSRTDYEAKRQLIHETRLQLHLINPKTMAYFHTVWRLRKSYIRYKLGALARHVLHCIPARVLLDSKD